MVADASATLTELLSMRHEHASSTAQQFIGGFSVVNPRFTRSKVLGRTTDVIEEASLAS